MSTIQTTYFERNRRWLNPMVIALILLSTPIVLQLFGGASPLPPWVGIVAAAIGFCISGIYAALTDTMSAHIMRFLAQAVAALLLGAMLWKVFAG